MTRNCFKTMMITNDWAKIWRGESSGPPCRDPKGAVIPAYPRRGHLLTICDWWQCSVWCTHLDGRHWNSILPPKPEKWYIPRLLGAPNNFCWRHFLIPGGWWVRFKKNVSGHFENIWFFQGGGVEKKPSNILKMSINNFLKICPTIHLESWCVFSKSYLECPIT